MLKKTLIALALLLGVGAVAQRYVNRPVDETV